MRCGFGVLSEYRGHLCDDNVQIFISSLDLLFEFQTYIQLFICWFYGYLIKISSVPKLSSHLPDSYAVILFISVDDNSESFQLLNIVLLLYFQPVMKSVGSSNFNPALTTSAVNTLVP